MLSVPFVLIPMVLWFSRDDRGNRLRRTVEVLANAGHEVRVAMVDATSRDAVYALVETATEHVNVIASPSVPEWG